MKRSPNPLAFGEKMPRGWFSLAPRWKQTTPSEAPCGREVASLVWDLGGGAVEERVFEVWVGDDVIGD